MPYMNIRYEQQNSNITPINDLFAVLTKRTECLSDYIQCSKSFFLEIIDAIYEASVNSDHKTTSSQDNSTEFESTLADVSKEELKIEPIVGGIYRNFCKKFRKNHKLTGSFINDATTFPRELLEEANTELPSNTIPTPTLSLNDNNSQIRNILNLFNLDSSNSNASASNSNSNNQLAERFYHESLLGILLSNSPLPSIFTKQKDNLIMFFMSNNNYEYQFFNQPTTTNASDLQRTQSLIDSNLSRLRFNLTDLFFSLLRSSPKIRFKTLKWLECCLATFNNRSKLWSNEILSILIGNQAPVSDGFMLNLSAVLLNLSKPFFASEINNVMLPVYPNYSINSKMLKIDPNYLKYCKKQETVLISDSDSSNQTENTAENANQPQFITRCFYMAHKAFHLGFRVVHERFTTVWQENNSLQQRLESLGLTNLRNVNRDTLTTEQRETLRKYEENLTIYLSMRSTLLETHYINHMMEFYIASAAWINNLAVQPSVEDAMAGFKQIISNYDKKSAANYFSTPPSKCLSLIPEFIIQNIIDFLIFLRYFEIKPLSLTIQTSFEPLFIMVLLFMGSPNRMRNPHLRAKMAEMLEALLPTVQKNIQPSTFEDIFTRAYIVEELFPTLLNGFVSIEISEDANNADVVAFEQKFNYRRPMYVVFKYLCTIESHQRRLISLAQHAEINIDNVQAPIFLKFINLLINDAIFLLDEGLSLMSKLRELQQERETYWAEWSQFQRQQNENNFNVFVKQMTDFEFDPSELVKNICRIYVNLACNNPLSFDFNIVGNQNTKSINPKYEQFCLAIGRDDRSYSPQLLIQAEQLLTTKLGQPMLGQDMLVVDRSVKEMLQRYKNNEIPMEDIPEEFLDPLMNTLMSDPVILPNSHKVLDRATITRHLLRQVLSDDRTDPYTRTPLTMDMLISDIELRKRIEEFVKERMHGRG
ncbi:Ubiquitin conjugation factor E4 A [Sarcoptes scabiei]|uniref:Ubiquitin conjugation factor E4 A n=1 Tax=Sarcoptes scabiei TaxID=52283 RepID=A0A834VCC6_SARSC|nr:Ubiquitin conjugation factor E4 A [Sarcoptes scabiei]